MEKILWDLAKIEYEMINTTIEQIMRSACICILLNALCLFALMKCLAMPTFLEVYIGVALIWVSANLYGGAAPRKNGYYILAKTIDWEAHFKKQKDVDALSLAISRIEECLVLGRKQNEQRLKFITQAYHITFGWICSVLVINIILALTK